MKTVSVVLPNELLEIVKNIGEQNSRKLSQEIRFTLTKFYQGEKA